MKIMTLIVMMLELGVGLILLNGVIQKEFEMEGNMGASFMSIYCFYQGCY